MRSLKVSILFFFLLTPFILSAQTHPLSFGTSSWYISPNWYLDYVNLHFKVITPAAISGEKEYTTANDGSGASTAWGGIVTSPLLNKQIVMPQAGDSLASSPITVSMTGKIALIYRGSTEYGAKALAAQTAGAIACIIVSNLPGAPFAMAAGAVGSSVTIPVYMISKADGDALDAQYCSGIIPTMTITPWGQNFQNDLGFVTDGLAAWHDYAIPTNQLNPGVGRMAYKGADGAFVANYGTHKATHVTVNDTLRFTPTGGAATVVHTGVTPMLTTFLPVDSIYAMFNTSEYNLSSAGTGRFDLKYTIASDSTDQYPADNTGTVSFYTTDSVYSKSTYDFAGNKPVIGNYFRPGGSPDYFLWGPTYYVAHGGTAISAVQFSLYGPAAGTLGLTSVNIYALKWVDGSGGYPLDSLVQNGELTSVASGVYNFSPSDTSGQIFKAHMTDPGSGLPVLTMLDSNSWYYIAIEVPGSYYLGVEGRQSPYPRIYGRLHTSNTVDYSGILWRGAYSSGSLPMTAYPSIANSPCTNIGTYYVNAIDSFNYNSVKGQIPAVALIVNNNPIAAISGPTTYCAGSTYSPGLTDPVTGGTWSSSNPSVATIGLSSGDVTAIASGTTIITYATSPTVHVTTIITVNPVPVAGTISGPSIVCTGATITLTTTGTPGTWSSSSSNATVSASGVVTGVSVGTATITYTASNSCGFATTTHIVTVNAGTGAGTITGTPTVCVGSTTSLSDAMPGGAWSSTTSNATITPGGVVTGVSAGTTTISYTITGSCGTTAATYAVTIDTAPVAGTISGGSLVCVGATIPLTTTGSAGTWSSGSANATVSASGFVTGVTVGTATISYTVANSCGTATATHVVTVNAGTGAGTITGPSAVCTGSTITLSDGTPGGVWSSTASTATITTGGVVTGASAGTTTISYTFTSSCGTSAATYIVTVDAPPFAGTISGGSVVCTSATIPLTTTGSSGTWSSSSANATVSSSGVVTGVIIGTATISYTVANSCGTAIATHIVTVNAGTGAGTITGPSSVCVGSTIPLADAATGGVWSSTTPSATITTGGVVTGASAGTTTISYTFTSSCGTSAATHTVTVNPLPDAGTISGLSDVCLGATVTLTVTGTSGTWSSSSANATVSASGIVTGVTAGTATISYSVTNTCGTDVASMPVTVNAAPDMPVLSGPSAVCIGSSITLSGSIPGGTWSTVSGNASVAAGVITGVTAGTDVVSYTFTNTCGSTVATATITVNPLPVPVISPAGVTLSTTLPYATYQWLYSTSNISGATDATYNATLDGAYAVTVTDDNGCTATSDVVLISTVGVNNVNAPNQAIIVSPNPTSGVFTVQTTNAGTFTVYSVEGKEIRHYNIKTGTATLSLPSGLAAGVYMCRFNNDNGNTAIIRLVYEP